MKLQPLFLIALLASTSVLAAPKAAEKPAQRPRNPEEITLNPGFQLGANFSSASITNPKYTPNGRTGLAVGGLFEIGLTNMFFVQPELMFVQRGAETAITLGNTITTKLMYSYLELPVLFKVKYPDYDLKPYVFFGPNLGVLLSSTFEQTTSGSSTVVTRDASGTTQNTNFSLDFGLGAEHPMTSEVDVFGTIKYSLGLTDVTTTSENWKNNGWQILAGGKLHL